MLGDLYGNVLENGELSVGLDETGFFLRYYERKIPLDPSRMDGSSMLAWTVPARPGNRPPSAAEIEQLRELVREIPPRTVGDPGEV